jgi:hypothetical protein
MKINQSNLYNYDVKTIGNNKVEFFTEKVESACKFIEKYEFFFRIEESTTKKFNFFIRDLHQIYTLIQDSILSLIDDVIIKNINNDKVYQLIIEAESADKKELELKQKVYDYHFERLAKSYTDKDSGIYCHHTKDGYIHTLNFMKLKVT